MKATIPLAIIVLIAISLMAIVIIWDMTNLSSKSIRIERKANMLVDINDQTVKVAPLLESKTGYLGNSDIIACIISRGDTCGEEDAGIARLADTMGTKLIVYSGGKEVKSYGDMKIGDTVYVNVPLPGGNIGEVGFLLKSYNPEHGEAIDSKYTLKYGDCFAEGKEEYRRNHLESIDFMGKTVSVHSLARSDFEAVVSDIKACEDNETKNYDFWREPGGGTYECRENVNAPGRISMHAYGLAIDINPQSNPNCPEWTECNNEVKCISDIPQCVIDAFHNHNFRWGCDPEFRSVKDSMHFEWKPPADFSEGTLPSVTEELKENEDRTSD